MTQAIRHIDDTEVQDKADEAASAACKVLDEMFPGYDNGGITSNYIGHLKDVLLEMLAGRAVLRRSWSTDLPQLILTDSSFGSPLVRGDAFLVIRRSGDDWVEDRTAPSGWKAVPRFLALNDSGTAFVPLSVTERIDPFTSFDAAVQGALGWLRREEIAQSEAQLVVIPVAHGEQGYVLNPDDSHYVTLP